MVANNIVVVKLRAAAAVYVHAPLATGGDDVFAQNRVATVSDINIGATV